MDQAISGIKTRIMRFSDRFLTIFVPTLCHYWGGNDRQIIPRKAKKVEKTCKNMTFADIFAKL